MALNADGELTVSWGSTSVSSRLHLIAHPDGIRHEMVLSPVNRSVGAQLSSAEHHPDVMLA
jgi:hypothetical protein